MVRTSSLISRFNEAQRQLVVQTADLPLGTLADMVESSAIDLSPSFQRRERWDPDKQSALIESFLLNVPVPPVYLAEQDNGTYTAIDGKQRLRAIAEFMHGRLKLKNLEKLEVADGMFFEDLPEEIANAFRLRPYLRVVTLLKQTSASLKYEVFLRLNRGGEILNAQEIRNVAYRGSLNDLIYDLSENEFLKTQLKIKGTESSAYKDMSDAEYVLRYLTLIDRLPNFSGKLAHEMNDFMEDHQNAKKAEIVALRASFETAIGRCQLIWAEQAFKRYEGNGWRDQFLAGMFDAQMLAVANMKADQVDALQGKRAVVLARTRDLFENEEFEKSVRTGTNTPARIKYRVEKVSELLHGI